MGIPNRIIFGIKELLFIAVYMPAMITFFLEFNLGIISTESRIASACSQVNYAFAAVQGIPTVFLLRSLCGYAG